MTKKEWIPLIIAVIMLMIGSVYDYVITDTLYMSFPLIGMIFERILLFPIEWIVVFTLLLLYQTKRKKVFIGLAFIAAIYVVYELLHYWISDVFFILVIATVCCSILLLGITLFIVKKLPSIWIDKHLNFFLFYTAVLLSAVFITTILKIGWGRIRYRDMEQVSQFCVWYRPCAMYGHNSFPSGHTTAFTSIICFLQWKENPYAKPGIYLYIILICGIILMPLTRMIMGAHFLSDTAMGFIITYSCYLWYRNYFRKRGIL